jgi:hypothetical protein
VTLMNRDYEFERSLLASARADASPQDVQRAWSTFSGALAGTLERVAADRIAPPADGAFASPRIRVVAGAPGTLPGAGRAVTWLLLGALGGTGVTLAVMSRRHELARPVVPAATVRDDGAGPASPPPVSLAPPPVDAEPVGGGGLARRRGTARPSPASTLAAEVSRLDTARTAIELGDHDGALRMIDAYHASFPAGALAADADVVALEAAAAKHDRAEVARLAAAFLSRYPDDPHAARVRSIAARASSGSDSRARTAGSAPQIGE